MTPKMTQAPILAPALHAYYGAITDPKRWSTWTPRIGDILVCTPPKCGTTWTQTILAMLIHGGASLPEKLPVLSPWVDADLGVPAREVTVALARQEGRRVVKTHAPADGFPIWQGVTVIAVYRHPLDVFFSLRKHADNAKITKADDPLVWPVSRSLQSFIKGSADVYDFEQDTLVTFAQHYTQTALSGRLPDLKLFHYADMVRDGRRAVVRLAEAAGIEADACLIDAVTEATSFGAMKAKAVDYAPVGGTGFWKSDAGFFDSASSQKWLGVLSEEEIAIYDARLAELIPDRQARAWLEQGHR